nr:MAG TPA: hypothetical protein [Bacteriophage sp.]
MIAHGILFTIKYSKVKMVYKFSAKFLIEKFLKIFR